MVYCTICDPFTIWHQKHFSVLLSVCGGQSKLRPAPKSFSELFDCSFGLLDVVLEVLFTGVSAFCGFWGVVFGAVDFGSGRSIGLCSFLLGFGRR